MTKYRTTGHDVMRPGRAKAVKPGKVGEGRLGIYDHAPNGDLRLRGQCGPLMTSNGVSRFHGILGSKIQIVSGKKAWVAPDRNVVGGFGSAQKAKLAKQLRTDRGSVSSKYGVADHDKHHF